MDKFSWSPIQPAKVLEESRAPRFRPEWRDVLLSYFGIGRGMDVLEVCCGPGTFAPYLAEDIRPGSVTGLDLDEEFILRAQAKAKAAGMADLRYVVGDAYALPFPDATFDAVTSYTGIGVLNDPAKAMAEMVRVCRPGGVVSVAEAVTGPSGITFHGVDDLQDPEPYPGARRFRELQERLRASHSGGAPGLGSRTWPAKALWGLLPALGLKDVQLHAWGHVLAPDDSRLSLEHRLRLRDLEHEELAQGLTWQMSTGAPTALSREELAEMIELSSRRRDWACTHPLWDWEASLSTVAMAHKPRL